MGPFIVFDADCCDVQTPESKGKVSKTGRPEPVMIDWQFTGKEGGVPRLHVLRYPRDETRTS